MTLLEAIQARHSVRYYKQQSLSDDDARALQEKIDKVNREGRLHIQLIRNEPKAFLGPFARYGKFRGVTDYLVMAGVKAEDLDERIGYYGEQLVLLARRDAGRDTQDQAHRSGEQRHRPHARLVPSWSRSRPTRPYLHQPAEVLV